MCRRDVTEEAVVPGTGAPITRYVCARCRDDRAAFGARAFLPDLAFHWVDREIGRGVSGTVLAARDRFTGSGVAIKLLDPGRARDTLERGVNFGCRHFIDENPERVYRWPAPSDHFIRDVDEPADYQTLIAPTTAGS